MPKSLTLSLTKLGLLSNTYPQISGISNQNGYKILPATPILLERLGVNSPNFINARNKELANKQDNTIIDYKLRPYQTNAVNFIVNSVNPGLAIFDEQRLGKTPTVLSALKAKNARAIIIVPKSLIYQWYEEYLKWYNNKVVLIDGNKTKRIQLYKYADINQYSIVLSYNTATTDIEIILKDKTFDYIVVDEAHRLRNIKKSRKYKPELAKAVVKIGKNIPYRIALSGTPAPNLADDIFGILHFLYPDIFTSYYYFLDYYFEKEEIYTRINGIPTAIAKSTGKFLPNKQKELLQFLETISIQRKRKEVMKWLPQYDITKITLPMDNEQQRAYENITTYYEYKNTVCMNALGVMLAQRQLAMSPEILECNTIGCKFQFILDYLSDYPEESIIIVSALHEPLKNLSKYLPTNSYKFIVGETSPKDRNDIKKDFQNRKCKIILANINVIKEGFTLDRADTIIFLESSFTYTDNIQCMDRLVPTAKEKVHDNIQKIILLIAKDSIDEYLYDMVYIKKATSSDIINNYTINLERSKNE